MSRILFKGATPTQDKFGAFLRQLRYDCNLTQKQLAKVIGINATAISTIELGKSSMQQSTFDELVLQYHISDEMRDDLQQYIIPDKVKETIFNPRVSLGLANYVKALRKKAKLEDYQLSLMMECPKWLIGAIESDNQPFTPVELDKFITQLNLTEQEIKELKIMNDYFEIQPKTRRLTLKEYNVGNQLQHAFFTTLFSEYDHDQRHDFVNNLRKTNI